MLKIFRQIRYNLMSENKTGRYIKYAIGEIFLVVIGILIALQINNWNQDRLTNKRSRDYLISLVEDIKSDIKQYNNNIGSYRFDIAKNSRLFTSDYKTLEIDSITQLVLTFYMPNKTTRQTYEKIKNSGLAESLGSEVINKAINDYYNIELVYYEGLLQWDKEYNDEYYKFWFYNNNYESSSIRGYSSSKLPFLDNAEKRKNDLINLIESTQGRNLLRGGIERHEHTLVKVDELKSYAENLVEMINKELSTL